MNRRTLKYIFSALVLILGFHMMFGFSPARYYFQSRPEGLDSLPTGETETGLAGFMTEPLEIIPIRDTQKEYDERGMLMIDYGSLYDFVYDEDSMLVIPPLRYVDGSELAAADSLAADSLSADSTRVPKQFLDDIITVKAHDSLVYEVRRKMVYVHDDGDVVYQDMNLKADFMEVDLETKNILAYGVSDTMGNRSRPEFYQAGQQYTMDTIRYNMDSKRAKVKGVYTQEGDGFLLADNVKMNPDYTSYVQHGRYTTCDDADHPHFYLAMSKSKIIPGKKIIVGPSHFVMEDVPIKFPLLPFGFFPITQGRSSGFLIPSFGEEGQRGFFAKDGGYYFAINDYIDVTLLGSIYTLGSWDATAMSRYIKRYKFSGTLNAKFSKLIYGDKGSADYINSNNFSIQWTHSQDPKFKPNSTFSASVNYATAGSSRYTANSMEQILSTQTSSSISYSKSWAGTPLSMSVALSHSQNNRDSTISLTLPNMTFNVSRVYPFKRKDAVGKSRWYEKISLTYSGALQNQVKTKERDLFTQEMYDNLKYGISHSVPVSASWTLLNYINIGPTFNYNERWVFKREQREWNYDAQQQEVTKTEYGFYRLWNYNVSFTASTKIYGLFQMKKEGGALQAVRHVMTPSVSFSYAPDFSHPKYGYYKSIQTSADGTIGTYSPYSNGIYTAPGSGKQGNINFSLGNNVEAKIRSQKDTTGYRKIRPIENLSISGSYNFLADSMNLSPFSVVFKTTIYGNYAINATASFDPYQVDQNGTRYNRFVWKDGKFLRMTSFNTSFGYTFNSSNSGRAAMNDINSGYDIPDDNPFFHDPDLDPSVRRMMMTGTYYDFSIPWNFGFNYSFNYTNNGRTKQINQTLGFQASANITDKWGVTLSSFGYDFQAKTLTPGQVHITRDLHCWQMNLTWVPIGLRKSWSFNISVKSAVLRDLKYDKSSSFYDNLYD